MVDGQLRYRTKVEPPTHRYGTWIWRYQNGLHVKGFEPKQAAVLVLALTHVQDQLPFVGHTAFGFYDPENVIPKHLDFFQGFFIVKVCVRVNWLRKSKLRPTCEEGDTNTLSYAPPSCLYTQYNAPYHQSHFKGRAERTDLGVYKRNKIPSQAAKRGQC